MFIIHIPQNIEVVTMIVPIEIAPTGLPSIVGFMIDISVYKPKTYLWGSTLQTLPCKETLNKCIGTLGYIGLVGGGNHHKT